MEKKNNESKTFGDIFSKVSGDIKEQDSSSENVSKKEDVKTFNSIFGSSVDSTEKTDGEKSFSDIFNNLDNKEVEALSFADSESKKVNEEVVEEFDTNTENLDVSEDSAEEFNNLVENDEELNVSIENTEDLDISKDNVEDLNSLVDDTEKLNMFVEGDKEINSLDDDIDELEGLDNNILFGKDRQEDASNNVVAESVETVEPKNEIDFTSDVESKENIEAIDNIDTSTKEGEDIFFGASDDKEEIEDKKEDIEEDNKLDDNKVEEEVSPFFEKVEEVEDKDNPFFDNNISLMENKKFSVDDTNGKIDVSNVQNFDVKIRKKKPGLLQSIIGVLSYALFIWLLLVGVALLVYVLDIKIRAAKGDSSPPKYGAYVVLTGSMLPEIQVYDVVITKKQNAKDLNEGDVITFASSDTRFAGTIITHRIIKKNYSAKTKSYTFQTKGDNNNVADSALVVPNNIYGKVILNIPKLGYLRDFLASDGGWILVILFPCLAVVSYDIVKIAKGLKRKKYNKLKVQSR